MITRPISRSISRSIALAINDPNGAGFDPRSLFAAGEQGVWYDPSDLSTLFQDAAGTIPVTAAGQPVGMMRDKSGRGNHATQATATSRPILQTTDGKWYLAFDGVDDCLITPAVNFTATDKMTAWSGVQKASDAARAMVIELSSFLGNPGAFGIEAPGTAASASYRLSHNANGAGIFISSPTVYPAPHTAVVTLMSDLAAPSLGGRVNAVAITSSTTSPGVGSFGNYPMYIGRRNNASLPFNGRIYSFIVRGAASSAQQITDTENYINSKTGAY